MNQEICRTSTKPERECVLGIIAGSGDVCVFGIVYLCGDFFDVRRTMLVPKIVEKKKSPVCPSKVPFFWAKILKSKDKVDETRRDEFISACTGNREGGGRVQWVACMNHGRHAVCGDLRVLLSTMVSSDTRSAVLMREQVFYSPVDTGRGEQGESSV